MINRRILLSGMSILASVSIATGAAFATFTDVNSSTGNQFVAGSLDLQLDDNNEVATSSNITASFGGTDMSPGGTPTTGFISLHNNGSVNMTSLIMGATQTATVDNGDGSNISNVLDLTVTTGDDSTCTTNGVDRTGTIATAVGDGFSPLTLSELVNADFNAMPALAGGGTYFVCMTAQLETGAGNQYQGDSATVSFDFTGNQ